MSTISFDRDGAGQTAHSLTREPNQTTYVVQGEHSLDKPSLVEIRRRLPTQNSPWLRVTISRRKAIVLDAGTENERVEIATAKTEFSLPSGIPSADIDAMVADLVGLNAMAGSSDLRTMGLLPN